MSISTNNTPTEVINNSVPPVEADPTVDDLGYDIDPAAPKEEVAPVVEGDVAPVVEEKIENPATGYKNPPVEEAPKVEVPPVAEADKTPDMKLKEEFDKLVAPLSDADKKTVSEFAVAHKLTKEQVEAYVNLRKSEDAKAEENQKAQIVSTRNAWIKELKDDKDFGGANFDKNVDRVEKVLQNFLPNTKKVLTERGSVLPPYIMRDLLSLEKTLNPTTTLVGGGPKVELKEVDFLDEMYK